MKYYIGLDMGTSSLGWAVTDDKYRLLRKKGKDMWGVRLFDEADTAAARRTNRVANTPHVFSFFLKSRYLSSVTARPKLDVARMQGQYNTS